MEEMCGLVHIKRGNDVLTRSLVQERKAKKKGQTSENHRGLVAKTEEEEWSENFQNNLDQLIAKNEIEMNEEQQKWIDNYNKWACEVERSYYDQYPFDRPTLPKLGDPEAYERVKSRNKKPFTPLVIRVAEMAIQFYNKNHEGSDFEVVEVLSANAFTYWHEWIHINFRAKRKNASPQKTGFFFGVDADFPLQPKELEPLFFAEHFSDDLSCTVRGLRVKITEGVISNCCLIEAGSFPKDYCGYCPRKCGVLHPLFGGFVFSSDGTFQLTPPPPLSKTTLPMARRGLASRGQNISLLTNHFKASIVRKSAEGHFYHYSVVITYEDLTPVNTKKVRRKILSEVDRFYRAELEGKSFAYDGKKSLFTVGPLPQKKFEFKVVLEDMSSNRAVMTGSPPAEGSDPKRLRREPRSKTYLVTINIAAKIPLSAIDDAIHGKESEHYQAAIRVLDVIIRQYDYKWAGRFWRNPFFHNFFHLPGGVDGYQSFHSSLRATQGGLSLNMDLSTTLIIQPGPVIKFLLDNQNVDDLSKIDWNKAKEVLKGLRVKATNTNMEYKITGLSDQICAVQKFSMKQKSGSSEGQEVELTVFEYFTHHRKIQLTSSKDFPCINVGKQKRPVFIPVELCSLVPLQRYTKALSPELRSSLVKKSRINPCEMSTALRNGFNHYLHNSDPLILALGIEVSAELMQVEGRVLEHPKLRVGNDEEFVPRNGRWNYEDKKLVKPVSIQKWAVVNFSAQCDLKSLCAGLDRCGQKLGILIDPPSCMIEEDIRFQCFPAPIRVEVMIATMTQKFSGQPVFILCVLPDRKTSELYGPWKKKTLSDLGIITQCMAPMAPLDDQYLTNLLLKINVKLGGLNSMLTLECSASMPMVSKVPTLILGMDVSHGSPGRSDVPSIAAVVGSRQWPLISQYRASVRTQAPKREMIDSLFKRVTDTKDAGIVIELLMEFYKSSGQQRPDQIIIFRDGVSESQFNQVLNIELEQIIQACKFKDPTWCPKFMVVVAEKRHNTKFFPTNSPGNVPPGTVIDNGICHPRNNDFYMCAQYGMTGTTRPTHYHVLYDDIGFSPDDLQELVHSLSYVYQRSTTAISVVAPICYAHLAASQMSQFINFEKVSEQSSSQGGVVNVVQELPRLHEAVASSMFFC